MGLRKEQIVLLGTLGVLGFLVYSGLSARAGARPDQKRAEPPVLERHTAPDTALALPRTGTRSTASAGARDVFSPPSDTRALPPLELIPPPVEPLAALRPPPAVGPAPSVAGRFMRARPTSVVVPDLFAVAEEAPVVEVAPDTKPGSAASSPVKLSAAELAARVSSWKKLYDWYRVVDFRFGQIKNPERYQLGKRANEDLLFVEFNPETGLPKFPGMAPAPIPRTTVSEFGFAASVSNEIEIRRAQFSDPLSAAQYDEALRFAEWCIAERHATPRALEVARETFTRAASVLAEDPAPRLGLARVAEAAFEFDTAHQIYTELLGGSLQRNPLVLTRLAELEARLRLFERAEEHLREAERYGRAQWQVQHALARFLHERGRASEALEHARAAQAGEPQGPEQRAMRVELRAHLGAVLLATGDLKGATDWFEQAQQADPASERARAGLLAASVVAGKPLATTAAVDERAGFELLLAQGLAAIERATPESFQAARQSLVLAAQADPLRAQLAWRALSWLAERAGQPEEALRFVERALEADPRDAWSLFQRGRLLVARDDLVGARESLLTALDVDAGYSDALAALGDLAARRADFTSADKYLERAVIADPTLVTAQALRGVNFLELGALRDAEDVFRAVLAKNADEPTARNGLAWCFYRRGNSTESLARLRELDDNRRAAPEDDPHRVWARTQIERITDHLEKVAWSERFDRRALMNGWDVQEAAGPTVSIDDGLVTLAGTFKANGRARLWQKRAASDFVSIEAKLTVKAGTTARVGLFVARETTRGADTLVESEVTGSRHYEPSKNAVQSRVMKRGEEELEYTDVPGFEWKLDVPVVLKIERIGEAANTKVRVLLDGIPVLENKAMPALGATRQELRIGLFAEGQTGRQVNVDIDDVEIVYRERR